MDKLKSLLTQYEYDKAEIAYLTEGFTHGFDIGYEGPQIRQSISSNLPLRVGSKIDIWNKLMKEIKLKCVAGPYDKIPFQNFIQSPIGLVPKAGNSGKTRLIFHLSFDFKNDDQTVMRSLNYHTPRDKCSVRYNDIDHAVRAYLKLSRKGKERPVSSYLSKIYEDEDEEHDHDNNTIIYAGKTDVQSTFRLAPLNKNSWQWLIMKAQDPAIGQWKYFIDKCLPFGASISCAIFQRISNALKFIVERRAKVPRDTITNYLDDFLFLALTILGCNALIDQFLSICKEVRVPISMDKTQRVQVMIIFLGLMLDGKRLVISIPMEKCEKAIKMLCNFVDKKKAMVKELQELCGYLNFLCKAIFPGRPFLRRMYSKYSKIALIPSHPKDARSHFLCKESKRKLHHHVRLDKEFKADCKIWLKFLGETSRLATIVNRPMIDILGIKEMSTDICFYSDASASPKLGYGCLLDTKWLQGYWDESFIRSNEPSIEYLELFALTAGILTWGHLLQN